MRLPFPVLRLQYIAEKYIRVNYQSDSVRLCKRLSKRLFIVIQIKNDTFKKEYYTFDVDEKWRHILYFEIENF